MLLAEHSQHNKTTALLWRLARAYYDLAELHPDDKQQHMEDGYSYGKQAVAANDSSPDAHRWCAVLAGSQAEFAELKKKVEYGQLFKTHIERAIELRPEDPYCHHLLGRWAYEVCFP